MYTDNYISIENVSKEYKKQKVLKNVSFSIKEGEIFGLLGPSGAGKTTLIRLIMGMESPNEGTINIMTQKVPNLKIIEQIGYTAQSDALYTDLSAEENIKFYCQLYKLPKKLWKEKIYEVLKVVNLNEDSKKIVSNFSGGMKRRLSLAISLIHNPKILILDEPTVGMDPILRQQIWNEFESLKNAGVTILITTHVMDEAEKCDRLAMLRNGNCISVGNPKDLIKDLNCNSLEEVFLKLGGNPYEN
ncbi:ABC transporter ATP-binding protein [Romboutsia sp.]|uniref:ABC transporter ATP-binding protein n=1 Tax=Romboutsia sp. TaxID=1965302 RepID=UPI003F37F6EA